MGQTMQRVRPRLAPAADNVDLDADQHRAAGDDADAAGVDRGGQVVGVAAAVPDVFGAAQLAKGMAFPIEPEFSAGEEFRQSG